MTARKTSVSATLTRQLAARILGGDLAPGEQLPGENELAMQYEVSRTTVRNALQVLAAKGLISVQAKRRSTVCEQDQWNCLDQEVITWLGETEISQETVKQLMVTRLIFEPDMAALAATHASAADLAAIEAAWITMKQAQKHADGALFEKGDLAFHLALLRATHNFFLQSLGNALAAAMMLSFKQTLEHDVSLTALAVEQHQAVLEAVRLRQADTARQRMREILLAAIQKSGELRQADLLATLGQR